MIRRLAAAAMLFAAGCASTSREAAPQNLETFNGRLFVPGSVNGVPVQALLDSGAEMTILDDDFAQRTGVRPANAVAARGSGGSAEAYISENVAFSAGAVTRTAQPVAIMDLDEVSDRLIGRPVAMIAGRDIFDAGRLRIDIGRGTFHPIERRGSPPGRPLPLTGHAGIESFPVTVEGRDAQAHFDLGNGSEVMVSEAFARRHGMLAPERIVARRTGGGIGGAVEREIVRLATLTVAGRTFRDVEAAVDRSPGATDLNIGIRILRHFLITTDFPQRTIWLEPR